MRGIINLAAIGALALGGIAFVGCENNNNLPKGENGTSAGGNGAFGESPARAGQYDRNATPPATQPSSGQYSQ